MPPLPHVLWLGGAPGSGKSTIASRFARRHGLRWYSADTRTWEHRDRLLRKRHPAALRWEAMTPHERWVTSTPAEMLELSLNAERGPMVVDDLRSLPTSPLLVAEGTPISPEVVSSGIADPSRALWLLPTAAFQRALLERRDTPPRVSDFYRLLAVEIERHARELDVAVLRVDGSRSIDQTIAAVEDAFAEALAAGSRAETRAERRALLREANEDVVSQCLAYLARPWTTGDAESFVREFACECGDRDCEEDVELAVAEFARLAERGTAPVVAHGHG